MKTASGSSVLRRSRTKLAVKPLEERLKEVDDQQAESETWRSLKFTVQVSFIDPCCPMRCLNTDDQELANALFEQWAKCYDSNGGEWNVELIQHPDKGLRQRRPYKKHEADEPFIYAADFPKSAIVRSHTYMDPLWRKRKNV